MFQPKFPEDHIRTRIELVEFMNYVVNGVADDVNYQVEFYSVEVKEDHSSRTIEVSVPISVPQDKSLTFTKDLANPICAIFNEMKRRCRFCISLEIGFEVSYLPIFGGKSKEMRENKVYIPEVEKIIHRKSLRGEFFSVVWSDNTKTTVKLAEGEVSDDYTAYLYALGKKIFEDKGKAREFIKAKKKVFEDEVAERQYNLDKRRRIMAIEQSLNARADFEDIEAEVYGNMFVAPALVSKSVFRKHNK